MYAKNVHDYMSLLRICVHVYAQIIQHWKTLLSKITIRNFCPCTQKASTSLLRICVYAQNIQVWNTYIPAVQHFLLQCQLYEEERTILYIKLREQLGIHTHNVYTLLGYDGHREISPWREQIMQEVGQYIERTARFKLAQLSPELCIPIDITYF